ncbi:olfactory receptor 52K1-like [Bufo gargarizans]|uniref:olfactory receptor 52K1-like n=1 Tax=Bufo gargarizans TaxID=30331 RepID=UPI001CF5CC36|nr:olfactory receptor 52K1-like [Bufo gargarizans]
MENVSFRQPSVLVLNFVEMSTMRYLYCMLAFFGYILIIITNGGVIITITTHKALQEPMYILICALCFNALLGSSAFFPGLFRNLLYNVYTISYGACILQIFCIYVYVKIEMSTLTVMAFDRYVCICNPLRYNIIMSLPMVYKFIAAICCYSVSLMIVHIMLTVRLPLCGTVILKIYCDNWSVVRLSCIDTSINNIYGLFVTFFTQIIMLSLILVSYIYILQACSKASQEVISKAMNTCVPQVITTINFVTDVLFEVFFYRYVSRIIPYEVRTFISVYGLLMPFILNPLIYGLKMTELRVRIFKLFKLNSISLQNHC